MPFKSCSKFPTLKNSTLYLYSFQWWFLKFKKTPINFCWVQWWGHCDLVYDASGRVMSYLISRIIHTGAKIRDKQRVAKNCLSSTWWFISEYNSVLCLCVLQKTPQLIGLKNTILCVKNSCLSDHYQKKWCITNVLLLVYKLLMFVVIWIHKTILSLFQMFKNLLCNV